MDMWDPYIGATREGLPTGEEKIVFDRFHIMREMTKAVDTVRTQEHRGVLRDGDESPLVSTKYLWLFTDEHRPARHAEAFATLQTLLLKVGARGRSYEETGVAYASVAPAVTPTAVSVTPASGGGPRQTFWFQYSSPAGAGDIAQTWQILHQSGQGNQSCVVGYYHATNTFVLWDDAGPGHDQTAAPNSGVTLENSQCRLHMPQTTVAGTGDTLTIVLDVSFTSDYFGDKAVTYYAYSNLGGYGTASVGAWTARPQLNTYATPVLPTQTITLSGVEFGTSGIVTFNSCDGSGLVGNVVTWGASSIAVQVPAAAVSGPMCVIVNGQASNTASLTVQTGPAITDMSPRWGPVSTPVTLTGANFGASPGTVNWDGAAVSYTQWADDHVTLTVPSGATSGHLTIVRNGVSSNGVAFEVGDESREYYHTDGVGSLRMVTGYDGDVVERHDYLPFGEEWPPRPDQAHIGFGGKERDQETGSGSWMALNYFGARSLESSIGRFNSPDPVNAPTRALTIPQRWNQYSYVENNPLRYVDPDGRDIWEFISGIGNALSSNSVPGVQRQSGTSDFAKGQFLGDLLSAVQGASEVIAGIGTAGTGVVAEGPSLGTSTVVVVAGATVTSHGAMVTTSAAVHIGSYLASSLTDEDEEGAGRPDSQIGERVKTRNASEAEAQLQELEKAQKDYHAGKGKKRIDSKGKSEQRAAKARKYRNLQEALDDEDQD
jgi:RHS repeat-associated protein